MAAIASSILLWKPATFFFINNGKLPIDFYNLSDDFLTNKKFKAFNGCFVYNDFGIFDLDFNFFVFFTHRFIPDT